MQGFTYDSELKGYRVWGIAARVGVQTYTDGDFYRPANLVQECCKLLVDLPVTINHVTSVKDSPDSVVGKVISAKYEEIKGLALVELLINDEGKYFIENRDLQELSVGYDVNKIIKKEGAWFDTEGICGEKGKQYAFNGIMDHIIYCDHLALCSKARAGSVASLFICDDINMEDLKEVQSLISGLTAGLSGLETKIDDLQKKVVLAENLADSLTHVNLRLDSLLAEKEVLQTSSLEVPAVAPVSLSELVDSEIKDRLNVARLIGDSADLTLDAMQQKKQFLKSKMGNHYNCDSLTEDQITACFDMVSVLAKTQKEERQDAFSEASSTFSFALSDNSSSRTNKVTNTADLSALIAAKKQANRSSLIN